MRSSRNHIRVISKEILGVSVLDMSFENTILKLQPHLPGASELTHCGRVTHICVGKLTIIDSDNGLSPGRRQAIIWTNAGILLIGSLGTNFNEILIGVQTFSFKKMHLKMSSAKWCPFCLGLNVLSHRLPIGWCCWLVGWCCQAISHYLSQSSPRFMSSYGVTRPQWVLVRLVAYCRFSTKPLLEPLTYYQLDHW